MLVSKLIPSPVLRRIDRYREARILAVTTPAAREYVGRYGLEVRHGPFAGMRYIEGLEASVGDLIAKLAGVYERELQGAVTEWIDAGYEHVIDIGSAEGYYAVGFAHAMPGTVVSAYDIDPAARERCAAMAALNETQERVRIGSECTLSSLREFPDTGVALLSDCEGAELELLDPVAVPQLCNWPILVELHDFVDPSISATIRSRFERTHDIELIRSQEDPAIPDELDFANPQDRRTLIDEHRPEQMLWAHMRPRSSGQGRQSL